MEPLEANTQVFIVRVWLEPRSNPDAPPEWRGVIEHAPTRERRYIKDLNDLADFVAVYLAQMGVKVKRGSWLRRPRR
jgi:hypothetical protein